MHHIDFHILQSLPVASINQDEFDVPKTAFYGGVVRGRISSQAYKYSIRQELKSLLPEYFQGIRTRILLPLLMEEFQKVFPEGSNYEAVAKEIASLLTKMDEEKGSNTRTLLFTSRYEIRELASAYIQTKDVKKAIALMSKNACMMAGDIAFFGRMLANNTKFTVQAAAMFSHALTTHQIVNEVDFYTALDDQEESKAAAFMGRTSFTSGVFYRFCALNLNMLADEGHLGCLSKEERQKIVAAFIETAIKALPGTRENVMHAYSLPVCVLAVVYDKGHPIQLSSAFEKAIVASKEGFILPSIKAMKEEFRQSCTRWELKPQAVFELSPFTQCSLSELIRGATKYVL